MSAHTTVSRYAERNFYTVMAVVMLIAVFIGFARTFFLRPLYPEAQQFAATESIFYVHGVMYAAWMFFLVGQSLLVRAGNTAIHRKVGTYGAVLAAGMVVIGLWAPLISVARPGGFVGVPIPPQQFLVVPFFDVLMFGLFVVWAIARRNDSQSHKRLMLFATINLLEAAFARYNIPLIQENFPVSNFLASDLFIFAIIAWDLVTLRKLHRVTAIAAALTLTVQVGRFLIMETDAWLGFANWLAALAA